VGATAEAVLQERKLSAVVSDSIGREELNSGASSDAAGALQKVTGVSVVGGGFVYVRGLGERYSSTQLNGAAIPTTEPEKRVVPLDLFPASLIENIKIAKTYSPDLPAEFSGGVVQMQTIEFPTQRMFNLSFKTGFNTATTFNKFLTYPGGSGDFFGFGGGSRAIPASIPTTARLFPGQFTKPELQAFGQAFPDNWEPTAVNSARPALDWSASGGGTFGRFGIVGAISFTNKPQVQSELQNYIRQGAGAPIIFTNYPDFREYSESAKVGAIFNTAVRLTPSNKLIFRNTYTHDADKTAREFSGYDGGVDTDIASQRLRYIERSLLSTGVEGDHSLAALHNSLLHWQFTYSDSTRNEPDLREVLRNLLPDGRYSFSASGSSGVRFFADLHDKIYEPQADYSIPFFKGGISGLFKAGVRATVRRRDFSARRFLYAPQQFTTLNLFLPSNQLFGPDNIRPTGFQITEFTRATDTYAAEMNIFAGYAMVDISFGPRMRLEGGVRIEDADQRVITYDNRVPNATPVKAGLQNRDPAPAINAIYSLSKKQNFRLSYSRTVSRPDFRELSPFDFNNVLGGFVTAGNPDLKRAVINNFDARWEYFSSGNQLLAASFFAKTFTDPIEQTIVPSNDLRQTFVNAKGARNIGIELELRRSLVTLTPRLREFAVSGNFTFVDSNIEIRPEDATIVTSQSRPLLGQSRYIANAVLQWTRAKWRSDAKFYANYVSRRVSDAGTFRVPDIYQEANTFLDFVYQYRPGGERGKWAIRFEAENLADNDYRWTQGPFVQRDYHLGRNFQIGFSYSFF
jgi:outer membrane receptor protein involved in Fe transport